MIEIFYELTATVLQNFLITWFISKYCGYKYEGIKRYIGFFFMWAADCIIVTVINKYVAYDGILSFISILAYIIYCHICLKKDWFVHIFAVCFAMVMIFTISSVIFLFSSNITGIPLSELYNNFTLERKIILVVCRLAEFTIFKFVLYLNKAYNLSKREWVLFASLTLITWLEVVLCNKATILSAEIKQYMFGTSLLTVVINILMYYFVLRINRESKLRTEFSLLRMQYENVKETEENLKALYDSGHALKHDLEKHFLAIKAKAEQINDQGVIDYVDKIINKYIEYAHETVFTKNNVLNAIINIRLEICNHKGISTRIQIENDAVNNINDEDIAVLFGNIFDNAIEAADKTEDKFIILNVQKQGAYISIYMENSFDGVFDEELKTKKDRKNEHGIGMKNVKNIVEEYNGMLKCFSKENVFCCDILLGNYKT